MENINVNVYFGDFEPSEPPKTFPGKVKFLCSGRICSNKWTSVNGTVQFQYSLNKYNKEVGVKVFMFSQKCKKCEEFAQIVLYQEENLRLVEQFTDYIQGRVYGKIRKRSEDKKRPKAASNTMSDHISSLCGACQKGCCSYSSKSNNWRGQRGRFY
eukprot:403350495